MNRIYPTLAMMALGLLALPMLLGLSLGDVTNPADLATQKMATVHRLSGVLAAVVVLLVNSIAVTYFIGTSRWCKEVSETYRLPRELIVESTRLKRTAFPWSVSGMLIVVGIVALGGAADPGATMQIKRLGLSWATWHLLGACGGIAVLAYAYFRIWQVMVEQSALINRVMNEVRKIRLERGLSVEEPQAAAGA